MIGVMMTYKPSPKPNFHEPTHIDYKKMETYMWGDDEAGKVKDWIYVSNKSLHQIIFGLEPGGSFKHSDQYRTIFGADELLYVLSGVLIINNPETGETHKILPGESVFFKKDTWHHAFNYSEEYLQVLEFFSPPPITGTSGAYAKEKKLLKNLKYKRDNYSYPSENFKNENAFKIIRSSNYIWSLEGKNKQSLIATLVKTINLDVKIINLQSLQESDIFKFKNHTTYLSLTDNLEVNLDNHKKFILNKKDGLYLPHDTSFKLKNLNNFEANIILCIGI